jgi:hypothetical protein
MTDSKEIKVVVGYLKSLLLQAFGSKINGRYFIHRDQLLELSKRTRLTDSYIRELIDECFEQGLAIFDMGKGFAVNHLPGSKTLRPVSAGAIQNCLKRKKQRK